ncbi:MAG TPA: rhomboid family intramembrane serine protease [Steroidobacteraceae bacterium]|nr:rhomboid family intramembrane serine protease [Steroidobacteraceae bacterium]
MLIFPLGKRGTGGVPIATIFVCVACILVQVFTSSVDDRIALAFHPDQLDPLKMFTSVLTHGDFFHLVGNLFFFYCFARTAETQMTFDGYLLAFMVFVLVTNLAYAATAPLPIPTLGLSGVVWGFMGIFLFRHPREYIECWVLFLGKVNVPAAVFILGFLAFDIANFRSSEDLGVNYAAHFSGFAAGALFKLLFWNIFTTEEPESAKRTMVGARFSHARTPRR